MKLTTGCKDGCECGYDGSHATCKCVTCGESWANPEHHDHMGGEQPAQAEPHDKRHDTYVDGCQECWDRSRLMVGKAQELARLGTCDRALKEDWLFPRHQKPHAELDNCVNWRGQPAQAEPLQKSACTCELGAPDPNCPHTVVEGMSAEQFWPLWIAEHYPGEKTRSPQQCMTIAMWREFAEAYAALKMRELREERDALKRQFGRAMIVLKGLNLSVEWELAPSIKKEIAEICAEFEGGGR